MFEFSLLLIVNLSLLIFFASLEVITRKGNSNKFSLTYRYKFYLSYDMYNQAPTQLKTFNGDIWDEFSE